MATSEKTVLLEKILAQHKEKTKQIYLPLKLKAADLKIFGFAKATPAPSANALKEAVWPFLGDNLMLKDKDGVLCLSQKMTQEEWERLVFEEKNVILRTILSQHKAKEKKSFMPLKLKAAELKIFGLTTKSTVKEIEKNLTSYLGSEMILLKKEPKTKAGKPALHLAYKMPPEAYVHELLVIPSQKKNLKKTLLQTLADDVPLDKAEFLTVFNRMLDTGQLQVTKIDEKFGIVGFRLQASDFRLQEGVFNAIPEVRSPKSDAGLRKSDAELFHTAFEKLDRGRIYVRICDMRRELAWNEERFNTLLRHLRKDGTIQLHAGDASTMTEEDISLSYTDENYYFYATMTLKKR